MSRLSQISLNDTLNLSVEVDDPLWKEYVDKATLFDERMIDDWNKIVDVILVYVGLIISVLTSFVIETFKQLQRNPADTSNDLLVAIYNQLAAQSNNKSIPIVNTASFFVQNKTDHNNAIIFNGLLYNGLALCIVVSVVALAAKLWLISYTHRSSSVGSHYERAMKRQAAYNGVVTWKMGAVINALPIILLIALIMFGFFIHLSVWAAQKTIGFIVGTVITMGLMALAVTALAAAFIPSCPFHSSFSTMIHDGFKCFSTVGRKLFEKSLMRIPVIWRPSPSVIRCLRISLLAFVWAGSGAGVAYAILIYSSAFYPLVCVPIAITFAYSMQKKVYYTPQKYRISSLILSVFFVVAPMLAAAGYFRNPQNHPSFITLYIGGMMFLFFGGFMCSRMFKSMDGTGKIDAIAWLLRSTPSPNIELFDKASKIANSPCGNDYRPRLLESAMPILSSLILSHRTETISDQSRMEDYVSFLAQLSDFTDSQGSMWRMWEDAKRHPRLDPDPKDPKLYNRLTELAKNPLCGSKLKAAATKVLACYVESHGQTEKYLQLQRRQLPGDEESTVTLVAPRRDNESV